MSGVCSSTLSTSYVLYDYLVDNAFFGAEQVLVGSASSKTGLGLTNLLSRHGEGRRVVGLTSPGNVGFVKGLGTCDEVVTYDAIGAMDPSIPTAFVDMSGAGEVVSAIHGKFGAQLKLSCAVGATHWVAGRYRPEQPAIPHAFFFAPAQFAKRDVDWGPGEIMRRAQAEFRAHIGRNEGQSGRPPGTRAGCDSGSLARACRQYDRADRRPDGLIDLSRRLS